MRIEIVSVEYNKTKMDREVGVGVFGVLWFEFFCEDVRKILEFFE